MEPIRSAFGRRLGTRCRASVAMFSFGLTATSFAVDKSWNVGHGDWSSAANWSPLGLPLSTDVARIGNLAAAENSIVHLDQNDTIAGLHVTDGMRVYFDGHWLNVNGNTIVSGSNTVSFPDYDMVYSSALWIEEVPSGSAFGTNDLTLSDGAQLGMDAASSAVVNGLLSIDASSQITGDGVIALQGIGTTFRNDGQIYGGSIDGLALFQTQGGRYDLDGAGGDGYVGLLATIGSGLSLIGPGLTDSFSGRMSLTSNAVLNMSLAEGWTADANSLFTVNGADVGAGPVVIRGGDFTFAGEMDILSDGAWLRVEADATIQPAARIHVGYADRATFGYNGADTTIDGGQFTLSDEAVLTFAGPTTVHGGQFQSFSDQLTNGTVDFSGATTWDGTVTIDGVARQLGDATVAGPTTINADVFDFDGNGSTWTVNERLEINAVAIDTAADPLQFNTSINVGGSLLSRLTINMSEPVYWNMAGQMTLAGSPIGFVTRVAGSTMLMSGDLELTAGQAQIAADTILSGTTTIPAGATLRLAGYSQIFSWAEFVGTGTLRNASSGTIDLYNGASLDQVGLINDGVLAVSLFPGTGSVARFENTASGTWSVNVVGDAPGSEHDLLIVSDGTATLAGNLRVRHYDLDRPAFRPDVGDQFTILTALDGVSGTFAGNPRSYSQGMMFDWSVLYGSNDVTLRLDAISACPDGDLDDDGDVDLQDLATLLAHFGAVSGATWPDGDIDADGDVELQDLAILLAHFGSTCP
jgi:hypothetical protein